MTHRCCFKIIQFFIIWLFGKKTESSFLTFETAIDKQSDHRAHLVAVLVLSVVSHDLVI